MALAFHSLICFKVIVQSDTNIDCLQLPDELMEELKFVAGLNTKKKYDKGINSAS